jgi:hypothetical protein
MVRQEETESHVHIPPSGTISDYCDIGSDQRIADILPNSAVINVAGKTADMICISSGGICGGDDFRCPRLKAASLLVGKAGGHQVEKKHLPPVIVPKF